MTKKEIQEYYNCPKCKSKDIIDKYNSLFSKDHELVCLQCGYRGVMEVIEKYKGGERR